MVFHRVALDRNPDNLLARSSLGIAHLELGARDVAEAQLSQVRARGGRQSWPEPALRLALNGAPAY